LNSVTSRTPNPWKAFLCPTLLRKAACHFSLPASSKLLA
jgi:hypothetical protein